MTSGSEEPTTTKIVIDPITRVEGHGKVTIRLNADGTVGQTRFHVVEFRGFERFIQGRLYWEVPLIIQRLCGICPVSHHLCAAKAMDMVVGVDQLTPAADKLRRLMHYGQILQSNALHFFHLASPDLLFGFDAPIAQRNIVVVAQTYPDVGRWAIAIRKYGQEVIKAVGGKKIHPTSAVPGGMTENLPADSRDILRKDIDQVIAWCMDALALCKRITWADAKQSMEFGGIESNYMSIVRSDGTMDLYDGVLRAIDRDGKTIFDGVTPVEYKDYLIEEVRPWSYMKFPHIRSLGRENGWYRVGPLAEINCCDFIDTPLAEKERQEFMAIGHGKPVQGTLLYHWARIINAIHAAEKIKSLLEDTALQETDLIGASQGRRSEGVAWIEAPRGTLFHHYKVDENDQVAMANLIVSTTSNNEALNRTVQKIAQDYLSGVEITEALLNHIEVGIRAYDPCLSCATHAIGQMPLLVMLEGPDGTEITRRARPSS